MGDMADWLTDQGEDEWALHVAGECDIESPCRYCAEASKKRKKKRRVKSGARETGE